MRLACIQLNSGSNKDNNLIRVDEYIKSAAKEGAQFISLPEVFNFRGTKEESIISAELITGKSIVLLQGLAQEYKIWILNGSFFEKVAGEALPFNTSVLINPEGNIQATYRKIHLFNVEVDGNKISESEKTQAGNEPCFTYLQNPAAGNLRAGFTLGMSICYDLRFPELYRVYAKAGAELLSVPSAFTKTTGIAHWHCLLRARAIENQAYVIAANQCRSASGVETYGHSLIVDPWGKILAEASPDKEEIIYAEVDLEYLHQLRLNMPVLKHAVL